MATLPTKVTERIAAVLLLLAPVYLSLDYVVRYGVNVPVMDDWDLVPLLEGWNRGSLAFTDLLAFHNEHRIFLPRLVMLAVAQTTRYNVHVLMVCGWLFLFATGLLLLTEYVGAFGRSPNALLRWVPAAWLLFTLRQHQNLLWGWQVQFFMCTCFAALTFVSIQASLERRWMLAVALLSALGATASIAGGFAVWPSGAVQLLCLHLLHRSGTRRYLRFLFLWLCMAATASALYFRGFVSPFDHPPKAFVFERPVAGIRYVLVSVGNPFASTGSAALAAGITLLLLVSALLWRRDRLDLGRASFALPLVAFGVSFACMLAVGRGALGDGSALESRYATPAAFVAYGVFRAVAAVEDPSHRRLLSGALLGLFVLSFVTFFDGTYTAAAEDRALRERLAQQLLDYRDAPPDALLQLYPDMARRRPDAASVMFERAEALEKLRFTVFAGPAHEPQVAR